MLLTTIDIFLLDKQRLNEPNREHQVTNKKIKAKVEGAEKIGGAPLCVVLVPVWKKLI